MSTTNTPKGTGIFGKVLAVMLLVAVLPTSLVWYQGHQEETVLLHRGLESRLRANGERLGQVTNQWLEAHFRMLRLVANHPDMVSMKADRQKALLVGITEQYPYVYLAHTLRVSDGVNEGRSDGKPSLYYGDRQYFRDATSSKGSGLEVVIGKTSGLPAFMLAVPIRQEGRVVGTLNAALLIEDISKLIVDATVGKTGFSFLLDASGKVVAHPDREFAKVQKNLSQHPAFLEFKADRPQPFFVFDESGKPIVAVAVGTRDGLTLITQQDEAEARLPIDAANQKAGALLGISVVVVALLALLFSRGLTNPIRGLTQAAEAISMGKMETTIPELARGDELGGLARAIDRMGVSLKLSLSQLDEVVPVPKKFERKVQARR